MSGKWSDMHTLQYEEVDKALNTAKLSTEKSCRKFCAGRIPWTPVLTQAIQRIQYWKGIAKCVIGGKIGTTVLK